MAVGARLYLVQPNTPVGDIGVILVTLGVLQVYEWAVTAILLLLHRWRRSPEDEPSLLLVAALFWTGPLAATVELSARQAREGLLCAVGVLVFALIELFIVRRSLALGLSGPTRVLAVACFVLLVVAPAVLHVENGPGTNELFLYGCWWLLAAIALLAVAGLRTYGLGPRAMEGAARARLAVEAGFVAMLLAASATHLYGMNYAFFGHARAFYGSPLLVAAACVAFEYLARSGLRRGWLLAGASVPAVAALALSLQAFDPEVPIRELPRWLRDPLFTALVLATVVWWVGALRNRSAALLHAGNVALACAVLRGVHEFRAPGAGPAIPGAAGVPGRDLAALALLALAAYLLIAACVRRSRAEAILGLTSLQAAVVVWALERPGATLMIGVSACWMLLIAAHLGVRRPDLNTVLWLLAIMLGIGWYYDFDAGWCWVARANAAAVIAVLLGVGQVWRVTRYRAVGAGVLVANGLFFGGRGLANAANPMATLIIAGSFVLLVAGAAVSWHKAALLALARRENSGVVESGESGLEA
jgi:hypothetical protein